MTDPITRAVGMMSSAYGVKSSFRNMFYSKKHFPTILGASMLCAFVGSYSMMESIHQNRLKVRIRRWSSNPVNFWWIGIHVFVYLLSSTGARTTILSSVGCLHSGKTGKKAQTSNILFPLIHEFIICGKSNKYVMHSGITSNTRQLSNQVLYKRGDWRKAML